MQMMSVKSVVKVTEGRKIIDLGGDIKTPADAPFEVNLLDPFWSRAMRAGDIVGVTAAPPANAANTNSTSAPAAQAKKDKSE